MSDSAGNISREQTLAAVMKTESIRCQSLFQPEINDRNTGIENNRQNIPKKETGIKYLLCLISI